MRAGRMDRRIAIQGKTVTQNDEGEEIIAWSTTATVWAEKIENNGQERFSAAQFIGKTARTFRFRWSDTVKVITVEHQILFDGNEHDIEAIREIGRREGFEVDCTMRSETQVDNG